MSNIVKLDGCEVSTAKSLDEIKENIRYNNQHYREVIDSPLWRENIPFAIVGGGPSLKDNLDELRKYKYIMACGSVHDYLIDNDIIPEHCAICDPDEIMIEYLQNAGHLTNYWVASQCSPKLFKHLNERKTYITKWHAGGDVIDNSVFGEGKVIIGGGCTVGTRAIYLAMGMGYNNIHLYGFDTCLDDKFNHHSYKFAEKDNTTLGNIHEISLGDPSGKKFYVAGYMLGQLFDFQSILKLYGNRIKFTVHGDGLLKHLMDLAELKVKENT